MNNPGKYDDLCTMAREAAQADGVVLMVINGKSGSGLSVQVSPEMAFQLPDTLEELAKAMRADFAKMKS